MASEVSLCNRALAAIGTRSTISSLDEASVEGRTCALLYESTRDEILGMAYWNFARKTALLGLLKSAPGTPKGPATSAGWNSAYPSPPWLYQYAYPSDCLQIRQIIAQLTNAYAGVPLMGGGASPYPFISMMGAPFTVALDTDASGGQVQVILTNQYSAIAVYTAAITNPALFESAFEEAVVQALAAKLAIPLTGQVSLASAKYQQANELIRAARASDGNEGLTVIDNMPDWITVREGYGATVGYNYIAPYTNLYSV